MKRLITIGDYTLPAENVIYVGKVKYYQHHSEMPVGILGGKEITKNCSDMREALEYRKSLIAELWQTENLLESK
jgi:hypothetical protein